MCIDVSKQRKLETFVRNEVIMLATKLVEDLLNMSACGNKPLGRIEMDTIENFYITDEKMAKAYGYDSLEAMQDDGADYQEIYEWWFVTEWLSERLRQKGEPVIDSDYGFLWGRTTTGQAIFIDSVIEEIYDELQQLYA